MVPIPHENSGAEPVLPPVRLVLGAILKILRQQKGRTIGQIEQQDGRTYRGDGSSESRRDQATWFTIRHMVPQTAKLLHIDLDRLSVGMSVEFRHMVTNQISGLRNKGHIVDWRKGLGIFCLADGSQLPEIDMDSINPVRPKAVLDMSVGGLTATFISILTHGYKDNTYKFALARAILEYCHDLPADTRGHRLTIPYGYLAGKFLNYYWHQECRLRLRQNFNLNKRPRAIQIVRDTFGGHEMPGDFELLDPGDREKARKQMLRSLFGHAKSRTSLVVPRFQRIPAGRGVESVRAFYDYDDDAQTITLRPEAFEFFKKNYVLLSKAVLVEWTKFLEPINKDLPMLATKIEKFDAKRRSLATYHKIFAPHADHCFYCMARLEPGYINVDHLIPWSYIFDDNAWNLVLACQSCNCKKSNSLPQEEFRNDLIARNHRYYDGIPILKHSLDMLDRGRGWDFEIQRHYETCSEYGFGTIHLP